MMAPRRWEKTSGGRIPVDDAELIRQTLRVPPNGSASYSHTHPASEVSDSSAVGRTVLIAANAAAARTAIGAQATITQQTAIPDATGGATVDAEARTAINAILAALRTQGLIAT